MGNWSLSGWGILGGRNPLRFIPNKSKPLEYVPTDASSIFGLGLCFSSQKKKKQNRTWGSIPDVHSRGLRCVPVISEAHGPGADDTGYTYLENLWLIAMPI